MELEFLDNETCVQMGCRRRARQVGFCSPHYVKFYFNKAKRDTKAVRGVSLVLVQLLVNKKLRLNY